MFTNKIMNQLRLGAVGVLSLLCFFGTPTLAFAIEIEGTSGGGGGGDASTLGAMFFGSCQNFIAFAHLFNIVAYAAGVVFGVTGLYNLRQHTENPTNYPLNKALMLFFGAACLMILPTILTTVAVSLGYAVSPTMAVCLAASGGATAGTGVEGMMANFVANIKAPLIGAVQVIANLAGIFMMVHGLMQASKYGYDPRTNSIHRILTNVGFGAILFTIGGNFSMIMSSVFGTSSVTDPTDSSVLSWGFVSTLGGGSEQFATAVAAALQFVQIIGFIAFVRGWLIMKKVVEGGGQVTMAQGITHILGGVCAINIAQVLKIFDNTLGTGMM